MRDAALRAVESRLARVAAEADFAAVLEPGAFDDAHQLAAVAEDSDLRAQYVLGWFHTHRHQAAPDRAEDRQAAVRAFTPCFVAGFGELPNALLRDVAIAATSIAGEMIGSLTSADVDPGELIGLSERICAVLDPATPMWAYVQFYRAVGLIVRYERHRVPEDLDAAVGSLLVVIGALGPDDPVRPGAVLSLGSTIAFRYEHSAALTELVMAAADQPVPIADVPAGIAADPSFRQGFEFGAGELLVRRYERTSGQAELDLGIDCLWRAWRARITPDVPLTLEAALLSRYHHTGASTDLDAAISVCEDVLANGGDDLPNPELHLANLGLAWYRRFERYGARPDIDTAIDVLHRAIASSTDAGNRAHAYGQLGLALQGRAEWYEDPADTDAAVDAFRRSLTETATGPARVGAAPRVERENGLGRALRQRYAHTNDQADLEQAIAAHRRALAACRPDHTEHATTLTDLAYALNNSFYRSGTRQRLDEAVDSFRAAVRHTPNGHWEYGLRLGGLGSMLTQRFEFTGELAELAQAIEYLQRAVDTIPVDHPRHAAYLYDLARAVSLSSERAGIDAHFDLAIAYAQRGMAVPATERPTLASRLGLLAACLTARYEHRRTDADLHESARVAEQAASTWTDNAASRGWTWNQLGIAMTNVYDRTGDAAALDRATYAFEQAIAMLPDDDPDQALWRFRLGRVLVRRFELHRSPADQSRAVEVFGSSVEMDQGAPRIRLLAATNAFDLFAAEPARTAELLERAVRLLPELAPHPLRRSDRQRNVGEFAGLANKSAAAVLASGAGTADHRAERALRILELGRGVLLGRGLELRGELRDLEWRHPELAGRFVELRDQLDHQPAPTGGALRAATERDRHALVRELAATIDAIRELAGFESFGLPPTLAELQDTARAGPIAVVNVTALRSDALLLTRYGVRSIPLPGLNEQAVATTVRTFQRLLAEARDRNATQAQRKHAQQGLFGVLEWLWDNAAEPVLRTLGLDRAPDPGAAWPRLWWAPGGLLGTLPLHAAGYHQGAGGQTVLDRVTSSYTPTVRALWHARRRDESVPEPHRTLLVGMPETPGEDSLPGVATELAGLRTRLPDPIVLDEADPPTKPKVLSQLADRTIAHFSCHGIGDPVDPSRSRLLLWDHASDPLTVASLDPVRLDRARLAYLSACHTSVNETGQLLDEAIHLASAFQLAGFNHVIGTLWEAYDRPAAELADTFYSALHTNAGQLDTSRAAIALHTAVRDARTKYASTPSLWAAYVHAGA